MCDTEVTCPSGRSHVHVPCGGFAHLLAARLFVRLRLLFT